MHEPWQIYAFSPAADKQWPEGQVCLLFISVNKVLLEDHDSFKYILSLTAFVLVTMVELSHYCKDSRGPGKEKKFADPKHIRIYAVKAMASPSKWDK